MPVDDVLGVSHALKEQDHVSDHNRYVHSQCHRYTIQKARYQTEGYIDDADLKAAAGDDGAAAGKSSEVFKQLDSDGNAKVAKSELSAAVEKVGRQLDAQMDQSRAANAAGGAKAGEGAGGHGGGGGASGQERQHRLRSCY